MDGRVPVKGFGHIPFFGDDELALRPLGQKGTEHRIQHTEVPGHINEHLQMQGQVIFRGEEEEEERRKEKGERREERGERTMERER